MANSLFIPNNYFVIPPPPRVSASSFSSKPIAPPPQPLLGFSVTNSSPTVLHSRSTSRRASFFKSHLSARGSVPPVHEAIAREESQEFPEGIVIQEIRRGFLLGGRLLRPAMVKVSIGPGSKKTPVATEKSTGSPATAASVEN